MWTSHFPSPTAARAGATRSPAGGADPLDTPPCESPLPGRRKRQSRHCPEHSWTLLLTPRQRRRLPRLWAPDTVLRCQPGMRAAPGTAWQPQGGAGDATSSSSTAQMRRNGVSTYRIFSCPAGRFVARRRRHTGWSRMPLSLPRTCGSSGMRDACWCYCRRGW